jgi:hypothetical protein
VLQKPQPLPERFAEEEVAKSHFRQVVWTHPRGSGTKSEHGIGFVDSRCNRLLRATSIRQPARSDALLPRDRRALARSPAPTSFGRKVTSCR